jgi:hypothetical protein
MPRGNLVQIRRGTKSQWVSANPILANGEMGFEIDTGRLKIGDGSLRWNNLNYIGTSENLIKVYNNTGFSIQKGQAVYFTGYDTEYSVPLVSPYIANGTISEQLYAGLMLEYASDGDYGFIVNFGSIYNLDTSGAISNISDGNESWSNGDVLYVHPFDYGKLTKIKPNKNIILVGIISSANPVNGVILARSFINPRLSQLNEIAFTNSLLDNSLIKYDTTSQNWKNSTEIDGGMV